MNQTLYIMRHGHASNPSGIHDFDRQLSESGKKDVRKIADWLSKNHIKPELILVSPLIRAQQTFDEFQSQFSDLFVKHNVDALIYTAQVSSLSAEVSVFSESPLMLIGHQPLLGDFANSLFHGKLSVDFPTASIVCINLEKSGENVTAAFEWQISPMML